MNTRLLSVLALFCSICLETTAQIKDADSTSIFLADPAMFYHQGTYYLYGTNAREGFQAYTSSDMKQWVKPDKSDSFALKKGNAFGSAQFWAPQVFYNGGRFYMAYAANENIAIAAGDRPSGPFTQKTPEPLVAPVKQIDPFVFTDDDGKNYLYHVRLTKGNRIFVAELTAGLSAIKPETLQECINAADPWENTARSEWPVAEGPSVLKHKNLYYLFYTANDFRNPDYAVGYAVGSSPYGPWKKYAGNPIMSKKTIGQNGTGHGDFVSDKQRNLFYVFHTHYSDSKVSPRRTAMVKVRFVRDKANGADKLVVDEKSFQFLQIKNGP